MRNVLLPAGGLLVALAAGLACYEPSDFPIACNSGWTCDCASYGTDDGCDAYCGVTDPDCDCPAEWTCPCSFYGTSDGCDSSCGAPDPDCDGGGGGGGGGGVTVPDGWSCPSSYYRDSDCDCGCGLSDPTCLGLGCTEPGCATTGCRYCWNGASESGSCTGGGGNAGSPELCAAVCNNLYQTCGTFLTNSDGARLTQEQCVETCVTAGLAPYDLDCLSQVACDATASCRP